MRKVLYEVQDVSGHVVGTLTLPLWMVLDISFQRFIRHGSVQTSYVSESDSEQEKLIKGIIEFYHCHTIPTSTLSLSCHIQH